MRFFNTTGPVVAADHYLVPPLERLDLAELRLLLLQQRYFVLHAPRQTGKTSALLALRDLLNREGEYRCVYANIEAAQAAREDVHAAMLAILGELALRAEVTLGDSSLTGLGPTILDRVGPHGALGQALSLWSRADPKPLVLLLDEVDALVGDTLVSVLRQLRAGYDRRPKGFPRSIVLCGVRDVRDYRIRSGATRQVITGGSAFNIKAESLRLGDFGESDVRALLGQHTAETGQKFTSGALDAVWNETRGQPWLVNALAYQACFRSRRGRDRERPIRADSILEAREELIRRWDTHLDQLADKLTEPRVQRVIEPLLAGSGGREFPPRDLQYVRDLGLVAPDSPVRMANPIYREVVPRELTWGSEAGLVQKPAWYVRSDGSLDVPKLLEAFQEFFREHSEHWLERFRYREAGPPLLLQAFLQRIVNSGGRIEREYGLGRRRTDLLIVWLGGGKTQKTVVECKVLRRGLEETIRSGARQTAAYMDRCAARDGHLVIFDRREDRPWARKIFRRSAAAGSTPITVWGM